MLIILAISPLFMLPLSSACTCEPNLVIYLTNNTSETLFVYVVYNPPTSGPEEAVGEVSPGSTLYMDLDHSFVNAVYITVIAKNEQDNIVFSQKWENREFLRAGMRVTILKPNNAGYQN